jgi:hypothetical protein
MNLKLLKKKLQKFREDLQDKIFTSCESTEFHYA